MTSLLVNLAGLALMAAVVWWFWLAPTKAASAMKNRDPDDNAQH